MTTSTPDVDAAIARVSAAIDEHAVRHALALLVSRPSAPGDERALAEIVAAWGRTAHVDLAWEIDALDHRSANLFARSTHGSPAPELVVYGHLDTSLTGDAAHDVGVTGLTTAAPPLRFDPSTRTLRGFGVGVAKAPSAAGLVAFAAAAEALRAQGVPHRLTLLLAAGGTHRAAPGETPVRFGRGVEQALSTGWRPDAVLNVKAGPAGVLYEEPAAAYLRLRVRRAWSAALARRSGAPDGGLARHAGALLEAIEDWRADYLADHGAAGQLAPEIAIGALRAGSPDKPDLLPGLLEVFVYAVLLPGEDPARVARELEAFAAPRIGRLPGAPSVAVDVYASAAGGATDPAERIVRLASEAWTRHVDETSAVRGWSGATDGAIFLARGVPTARVGVRVTRDADDPRIEIVSLDELTSAARAYADVAVRYFAGPAS
jgi:acetylornithine deacetylase/succinyl-diaminopimelate desuccinylase-like protein